MAGFGAKPEPVSGFGMPLRPQREISNKMNLALGQETYDGCKIFTPLTSRPARDFYTGNRIKTHIGGVIPETRFGGVASYPPDAGFLRLGGVASYLPDADFLRLGG